jgi:hypothetical protein
MRFPKNRSFATMGVSLALTALLAAPPPARAARVSVDLGACREMYVLLVAMHGGAPRDSVKAALDKLLDTSGYRVMFRHYNRSWRPHHLPPDVFERMILSVAYPSEYATGENTRADSMRVRWRAAYADLPRYERRLRSLEAANFPVLVERGVHYAQGWLPKGWTIPDFPLIVQPQGGSPAFTIDGAMGYDFLQLPDGANGGLDVDWLVGTIAHESNHLGMRGPSLPIASASDSMALKVVSLSIAEGVANAFVSGTPAGLAPAVPNVPFHVMTPTLEAAWAARVPEEPQMFARMADLLDRATRGALTQDELDADMRTYWFEGSIGRAYVFGSEIFAAIHLAFGKKGVLEAIEDPRRLFQLYNAALDKHPKELGRCVRVPPTTVAQALAIGTKR